MQQQQQHQQAYFLQSSPSKFVQASRPPYMDSSFRGVRILQQNQSGNGDKLNLSNNQRQQNPIQVVEIQPPQQSRPIAVRKSTSLNRPIENVPQQVFYNVSQVPYPQTFAIASPPTATQNSNLQNTQPVKQFIQQSQIPPRQQLNVQVNQQPLLRSPSGVLQSIQPNGQPLQQQQIQSIQQQPVQIQQIQKIQTYSQIPSVFPTSVGQSIPMRPVLQIQQAIAQPKLILSTVAGNSNIQQVEQQLHKSVVLASNLNSASGSKGKESEKENSQIETNELVNAFEVNQEEQNDAQQEDKQNEIFKLQNQVEELTKKLELKEDEVNIFAQYVNQRKGLEGQKRELEEDLVEAQRKLLQAEGKRQGESLSSLVRQQQSEIESLRNELQNEQEYNNQLRNDLINEQDINIQLRVQLNEKDQLIDSLDRELHKYSTQVAQQLISNDSQQNNLKIRRQEQESQVQLLKIQSLERNLAILEKENKLLRESNVSKKITSQE